MQYFSLFCVICNILLNFIYFNLQSKQDIGKYEIPCYQGKRKNKKLLTGSTIFAFNIQNVISMRQDEPLS